MWGGEFPLLPSVPPLGGIVFLFSESVRVRAWSSFRSAWLNLHRGFHLESVLCGGVTSVFIWVLDFGKSE